MSDRKVQDPQDIERICKLHAEEHSPTQIERIYADEKPELGLNRQNVYAIIRNKDFSQKIEKYRQFYLANPMDVAIANKRIRLDDMDRERRRIIATIDAHYVDKKDGLIIESKVKTYLGLMKMLVEVEREGREEVERKPDLLDAFKRIGPLADKTDEELISYERELTIKISAYKAGRSKVQAITVNEARFGKGINSPDQEEPA